MWDIVEEMHRALKVSPTLKTVRTTLFPGILGERHSIWDKEEEDGPPTIRIEEQDWLEIIRNQLSMCLLYLLLAHMLK